MIDDPVQEEGVARRLRWLMVSRVAIVTFLLGVATFIEIKGGESLIEISLPSLFLTILSIYTASIIYLIFTKLVNSLIINVYIQSLSDVALITGFVYATGGINSIYSVFYPLTIIYSVLYLGRGGGLIIASVCSILYGLLLDLEYYGIIVSPSPLLFSDYYVSAGYVFLRIFSHIFSFYIIALLASFVVEKEKKTRTLLAERESAFNQLDRLHRSIIESVDAGILTINLAGKIKSFNAGAEKITGFSFPEVENKDIRLIFHRYEDLQQTEVSQSVPMPEKKGIELTIHSKTNRIMILGCSISPLKNSKGKRVGDIIIFQDLTSLKRMEEQVERNRRLAFTGEMAAGLAHEMRNPLAAMSGSIQMLRKDLKLSESDERLMQIVLRGRDQLENFIRDFLLLAGPAKGVHEWIDLKDITAEIVESIRYIPDWHDGIDIKRSFGAQTDIQANREEMRQVLWNLALNAVQSVPDGGKVKIEIKGLTVNDPEDYLEITVSDTGCGIEEEHLEKVLEPFYTTKEKGTGLGLAVVNRIVEGYSGTIRFESVRQEGTTCTIRLPRNGEGNIA